MIRQHQRHPFGAPGLCLLVLAVGSAAYARDIHPANAFILPTNPTPNALSSPLSVNINDGSNFWAPTVTISPASNVFYWDGTTASSSVHVTQVQYRIWYNSAIINGNNAFVPSSYDSGYYYVVVRVIFDSANWVNIPKGTTTDPSGLGLQWINVGSGPGDKNHFAQYNVSLSSLMSPPHDILAGDVSYEWFPLSAALTGLSNPANDHSGMTYNDTKSAYYLFNVPTATSGSYCPFSGTCYYDCYTPGCWVFTNPDKTVNGYMETGVNFNFPTYPM